MIPYMKKCFFLLLSLCVSGFPAIVVGLFASAVPWDMLEEFRRTVICAFSGKRVAKCACCDCNDCLCDADAFSGQIDEINPCMQTGGSFRPEVSGNLHS